jgi:hypothetical protein
MYLYLVHPANPAISPGIQTTSQLMETEAGVPRHEMGMSVRRQTPGWEMQKSQDKSHVFPLKSVTVYLDLIRCLAPGAIRFM